MDKNHYFPVWHGTKSEPVKVVCNGEGWAILEKSGFILDQLSLPLKREEKAKDETLNLLKSLDSKDDVEALVKEKAGIDIDKRGSLETVKEKAMVALNESKRTNS
jgi:hypothetical protein